MARKSSIRIPWDPDEEGGGGRGHFKEGDYRARIIKTPTTGRSKEKDTPYIEFTFKLGEGPSKKAKGKTITERLYISAKALGRLRSLCKACGVRVPAGKKVQNLDLTQFKGKILGITLEDDSYERNGKETTYSTVAYEGFMSEDDLESGGVDEEEEESEDLDEDEDEEESEDEDEDEDEDDIDIDDDDL